MKLVALASAALMFGAVLITADPADAATQNAPTLTIAGSHALINGDQSTFAVAGPTKAKGATIALQRSSGGKWSTIVTLRANKSGDARIKLRVSGVGVVRYRAVVRKTTHFKGATTKAVSLSLQKWFYLSNMSTVTWGGTEYGIGGGSVSIAGQTYAHSVITKVSDGFGEGNDTYAVYALGYHCSTFSAAIGISDEDDVPLPGVSTVSVDDATLATYITTSGQSAISTLPISGSFRLRLESHWNTANGTAGGDGDIGWGNAGVLCSQNPDPSA